MLICHYIHKLTDTKNSAAEVRDVNL